MNIILPCRILVFAASLILPATALSQDEIISKVASLRPLVSTRSVIEQTLGIGDGKEWSVWYDYPEATVHLVYSDGKCTVGWLAPKDTLIESTVRFK